MQKIIFLINDTGAQNPSLVIFGLLIQMYSTMHLLLNAFYRIKISFFLTEVIPKFGFFNAI